MNLKEEIETTKIAFLKRAQEHESGDLAEEWMKAFRVLCEAELLQRKLDGELP